MLQHITDTEEPVSDRYCTRLSSISFQFSPCFRREVAAWSDSCQNICLDKSALHDGEWTRCVTVTCCLNAWSLWQYCLTSDPWLTYVPFMKAHWMASSVLCVNSFAHPVIPEGCSKNVLPPSSFLVTVIVVATALSVFDTPHLPWLKMSTVLLADCCVHCLACKWSIKMAIDHSRCNFSCCPAWVFCVQHVSSVGIASICLLGRRLSRCYWQILCLTSSVLQISALPSHLGPIQELANPAIIENCHGSPAGSLCNAGAVVFQSTWWSCVPSSFLPLSYAGRPTVHDMLAVHSWALPRHAYGLAGSVSQKSLTWAIVVHRLEDSILFPALVIDGIPDQEHTSSGTNNDCHILCYGAYWNPRLVLWASYRT